MVLVRTGQAMKTDFRDVKTDLRDRILSGRWAPGALVPNEVDLAAEFGCARATVNRAMRELADEGLIERKRKAGTRVRMAPVRHARFSIPVVRQEIEESGQVCGYRLLTRLEEDAPTWLQNRIGLPDGGRVLHLTCLHTAGQIPFQYEDRWINLAALPQASGQDFSRTGPNEWLIETVPFSDVEISFSAVPADDETARHLGCRHGDALFMAERATWWQGQAITYVRLLFQRGHKVTTRY